MATDDPLWRAISTAHAKWKGDGDRFPAAPPWEPPTGVLGTDKGEEDQSSGAAVPGVPRVPSEMEDGPKRIAEAEWEERAAILEFDAGLSREDAEAVATAELGPPGRV